jgi:hypothetical protein
MKEMRERRTEILEKAKGKLGLFYYIKSLHKSKYNNLINLYFGRLAFHSKRINVFSY